MLQIGPYKLQNRIALAPMAGITDSVFRDICIEQGAGYVVSEMVSADTTLHNSLKTRNRIVRNSGKLPHVVQIVGSDPVTLAAAACYNVDSGADIIDINMGCPAKKVCNKLAGSALLADENLVEKILRTVVNAVTVPVTLKIRTGPDRTRRNGVRIAQIAEAAGVQMLAVHGRTRADRFKGEAEFDTIAEIKQRLSIPVLANGDIRSPADAVAVLEHTAADGVMIGRVAQGNPWIFNQIGSVLDQQGADTGAASATKINETVALPELSDVHRILRKHITALHSLYGEYRGLRIARKHIAWYCKRQRGSAAFRDAINTVDSASVQLAMIDDFYGRALENAA